MGAPVAMLHDSHADQLRYVRAPRPSGTVMLVSWTRLADELKRSGLVSSNDVITHFVIDDDGVNLYLERC